jgi:hypothetical protein
MVSFRLHLQAEGNAKSFEGVMAFQFFHPKYWISAANPLNGFLPLASASGRKCKKLRRSHVFSVLVNPKYRISAAGPELYII